MSPLRQLRKERGLSGAELARRAGVHPQTIWQWETRRRQSLNIGDLCRLADVLNVSVDTLLGRESPPPPPVDALARADRQLLNAMERAATDLLGPQLLRLAGGWRKIGLAEWCGVLYRIRDHGEPRRLPNPVAVREVEERAARHRRIAAGKVAQ